MASRRPILEGMRWMLLVLALGCGPLDMAPSIEPAAEPVVVKPAGGEIVIRNPDGSITFIGRHGTRVIPPPPPPVVLVGDGGTD